VVVAVLAGLGQSYMGRHEVRGISAVGIEVEVVVEVGAAEQRAAAVDTEEAGCTMASVVDGVVVVDGRAAVVRIRDDTGVAAAAAVEEGVDDKAGSPAVVVQVVAGMDGFGAEVVADMGNNQVVVESVFEDAVGAAAGVA
jgi:hypothetical protein